MLGIILKLFLTPAKTDVQQEPSWQWLGQGKVTGTFHPDFLVLMQVGARPLELVEVVSIYITGGSG